MRRGFQKPVSIMHPGAWVRLLALLSLFSVPLFAEQGPRFEKWWPMCVLDATGNGAVNSEIKAMVDMAAKCRVHLDVRAFRLPPGVQSDSSQKFVEAAKQKCNITYGFQKAGVNRGSILAVFNNPSSAKQMCSAMGASERTFCGELSYDPGESFRARMGNTGYYGGFAKPGQPAVSIVSGNSINARDMSAVALGQGMMALPQGFGAGNGVGGDYEGQAAGGSNVDSGWSEWGCQQMRAAAFDNQYRGMTYNQQIKEWLPSSGRIRYVDIYDGSTPIFGKPMPAGTGQTGPLNVPVSGGAAAVSAAKSSPAMTSSDQFFRRSSNTGSQDTSDNLGHPLRGGSGGSVTNLRQRDGDSVTVGEVKPSTGSVKKGGSLVLNDDAKVDEEYKTSIGSSGSESASDSSSASSVPAAGASSADASAGMPDSSSGSNVGGGTQSMASGSAAGSGPAAVGASSPNSLTASSSAASGSNSKNADFVDPAMALATGSPQMAGVGAKNSAGQQSREVSSFWDNEASEEKEEGRSSSGRRRTVDDAYGSSSSRRGNSDSGVTTIGR